MKSWLESKTLWVGVATILTAIASSIVGGAGWKEIVLAAVGALNIFLRTQTDQPITFKKLPAQPEQPKQDEQSGQPEQKDQP